MPRGRKQRFRHLRGLSVTGVQLRVVSSLYNSVSVPVVRTSPCSSGPVSLGSRVSTPACGTPAEILRRMATWRTKPRVSASSVHDPRKHPICAPFFGEAGPAYKHSVLAEAGHEEATLHGCHDLRESMSRARGQQMKELRHIHSKEGVKKTSWSCAELLEFAQT
eukprot:scaffold35840_cov41-Phaeocystis_antarctica.AAC.1